jgi:hypothetical protein
MVEIPAAPDVSPQAHRREGLAGPFETMSRRYAAMDVDGCTDAERARLADLVRLTRELASLAPRPSRDDAAAPAAPQFDAELLAFERRREAMQRDLDKMRAVRLVK